MRGPASGARLVAMPPTAPSRPSDDGLFAADSVTRRLHTGPLAGVAGLRALLLQALHPVAMAAVDQHSDFRSDPWGRLERTGTFLANVTYGSREQAEQSAAVVRAVHAHVHGVDPETGRAYSADDPDLLLWIHCVFV